MKKQSRRRRRRRRRKQTENSTWNFASERWPVCSHVPEKRIKRNFALRLVSRLRKRVCVWVREQRLHYTFAEKKLIKSLLWSMHPNGSWHETWPKVSLATLCSIAFAGSGAPPSHTYTHALALHPYRELCFVSDFLISQFSVCVRKSYCDRLHRKQIVFCGWDCGRHKSITKVNLINFHLLALNWNRNPYRIWNHDYREIYLWKFPSLNLCDSMRTIKENLIWDTVWCPCWSSTSNLCAKKLPQTQNCRSQHHSTWLLLRT